MSFDKEHLKVRNIYVRFVKYFFTLLSHNDIYVNIIYFEKLKKLELIIQELLEIFKSTSNFNKFVDKYIYILILRCIKQYLKANYSLILKKTVSK